MAAMFCTCMGIYNSVVINSESIIASQDMKFVKRLDEAYGVVEPGRMVAASKEWRKLEPPKVKVTKPIVQKVQRVEAAPSVSPVEPGPVVAAVQEELNLNLVEVVNPKKWKSGVAAGQFGGSLITANGIIESLDVMLPDHEGISVLFSEMNGNVFEYDMNGNVFSGMMYQVDQNSYMVTLTNGPLEGTRLRFSNLATNEQSVYAQDQYAQAEEVQENYSYAEIDRQYQMEAEQAQGYNLEPNHAM